MDRELAKLSGKTINGRSIVFRQFNAPEEAAQCQVLFISRSELTKLEGIKDVFSGLPVLTVADSEEFCQNGGMLSLDNERGKIVFDVNFREIQRSKLKPNAQLFKLARRIYGRP